MTAPWTFMSGIGNQMISLVDESQQAYFRGRKLHGRKVGLPEGYEGKVLRITDEKVEQAGAARSNSPPIEMVDDEDAMDDEDDSVEVKAVHTIAAFDGFTIWGHEVLPNTSDDPYIRGVEEWVKMAEAIHHRPQSTTDAAT